jgi:hypothetical protein
LHKGLRLYGALFFSDVFADVFLGVVLILILNVDASRGPRNCRSLVMSRRLIRRETVLIKNRKGKPDAELSECFHLQPPDIERIESRLVRCRGISSHLLRRQPSGLRFGGPSARPSCDCESSSKKHRSEALFAHRARASYSTFEGSRGSGNFVDWTR